MKPYLSVIIPAFNEAERLPLTLVAIDRYLRTVEYPYEILVVNDGSTDNTVEVVKKMTPVIKGLKLVDNQMNYGKGAVVRQGMLVANGEIRLFTDADNATSIDQFEKMRPYFTEGYHVVIGSRAVKGAELNPPQPFYRQLLGKGSNLIIQLTNLPGIWDTQCGFKAFTAEAALAIFSRARISGWGFDIEILSLARELGYRIKEIPVRWVNDPRSHVKFSGYLKTFIENAKIRWWRWRGSYYKRNGEQQGKRKVGAISE